MNRGYKIIRQYFFFKFWNKTFITETYKLSKQARKGNSWLFKLNINKIIST